MKKFWKDFLTNYAQKKIFRYLAEYSTALETTIRTTLGLFFKKSAKNWSFWAVGASSKVPVIVDKYFQKWKTFRNSLENLLSYSEIHFGSPKTIWSLQNYLDNDRLKNVNKTRTMPLTSVLRDLVESGCLTMNFS